MGASFQYDLAPGVVVRMFEHVLAQRPCTSFVTLGLRAFGQREIVITFLRLADHSICSAAPIDAPVTSPTA